MQTRVIATTLGSSPGGVVDRVIRAEGVAQDVAGAALHVAGEYGVWLPGAWEVVQGLAHLAQQAPFVGPCVSALKDLFSLYKVGAMQRVDGCTER